MFKGLFHVQPLQLGLLPAGDNVDIVAAAQAVIEDAQQTVTVRRIVDTDGIASTCEGVVHKAGGLVAEAVVIISPCMTREQDIQGCDRFAPGIVAALLQPLGMLGQHGIDNLSESLVRGPHAMTAGKQISLKPPFAEMLAQYLHHAAIRSEFIIDRNNLSHRASLCGLEDGVQTIGVCLVRAEDAEVPRVYPEDVAEEITQLARGLGQNQTWSRDLERIIREVRK